MTNQKGNGKNNSNDQSRSFASLRMTIFLR
jgi:hypothetical protein